MPWLIYILLVRISIEHPPMYSQHTCAKILLLFFTLQGIQFPDPGVQTELQAYFFSGC